MRTEKNTVSNPQSSNMVMILIINNSLKQKRLLQKPTIREVQKANNYQILTLLYFPEGVGQMLLDCRLKSDNTF